ncbi:hypothetical protein SAMN04488018_110109 [Myroides marinus]|uniref:Uncharacterized protein n=1 Tax=Myroides marinus TaxID=703342 RepID=A0A1H6VVH0_9FLAO|nr:hypothetical protein [Myroides marinus]SEJ05817.1 hypothetical protein SAMN04488018_110109 [Myroides marinus]
MKRVLLLGTLLFTMHNIYAQSPKKNVESNYEKSSSELLNRSEYYELTADQRNRIIERKRSIGREFAAIGRDHSLTGREKGQKKRQLSMSFRNDIYAILNESQKVKWDKESYNKYQVSTAKAEIEYKLELLEIEYEKDIKNIETKYRNNDSKRKLEKNNRKAEYKLQKSELKRLKDNLS